MRLFAMERGGAYRAATDPCGKNALARRKDIDKIAVVGEGCLRIAGCSRANGAKSWLGCGRHVGCVLVLIPGSDGEEDVVVDEASCGTVECRGVATAQGHVGESATRTASGTRIANHVVKTGNDARVGAGAGVVENLDAEQTSLFGDAISIATDGTSAVSAVAIAISATTSI